MQRRCPGCGRLNTRRSSVHAYELEARHIFLSPYRCRDCRVRFWVISRNAYYLAGIVGTALVAGMFAWNLNTLVASPRKEPDPVAQPDRRFADLIKRAERDDRDAEYEVAVMYEHGEGVARSEVDARKWLERAAEHGNVVAQYDLGIAVRDGRGAVQDYERAAKWIQRAAEGGHAQAQFTLGTMYRAGMGVPANNVKAYMWLNLAAASGAVDAIVVRDSVRGTLAPAEIAEAQAEARRQSEMMPSAPTAVR